MSQENIEVTFEGLEQQQPVIINRGRRTSITEDAEEGLETIRKQSLTPVKKPTNMERIAAFRDLLYSSEYREFLGKDAMGWFKLSSYYAVFYVWLTFFFCSLLFFFWVIRIRGQTLPVYYNTESVMHYKQVNPGMGFRPQLNPEEDLVYVNISDSKANVKSLQHFLEQYRAKKGATFLNHHEEEVSFDVDEILRDSPCSEKNNFGMDTKSPCVAVKLNRIIGWLPKEVNVAELPANINETVSELEASNVSICEGLNLKGFRFISCGF